MTQQAIIYARVSRDPTGEGHSVARQVERCRHLALARDWEVVGEPYIDNSLSAFTGGERPAYRRALAALESGQAQILVAYHIDRITRSLAEMEQLINLAERSGASIVTVEGDINLGSEMGRMVARILAAVARAEVERKATRQRAGNLAKARRGGVHSGGQRLFGYTQDGQHLVEKEAAEVREAINRALAGVPVARIASDWNERGLTSSVTRARLNPRGDLPVREALAGWTPAGVKGLLINPRLAGLRIYQGETYEGTWPALIEIETHLAVKGLLTDPRRRSGVARATGRTPTSLLTGIAVCDTCGQVIRASSVRGLGDGPRRLTYACASPGRCFTGPREELDLYIESLVVGRLMHADATDLLVEEDPGDDVRGALRDLRTRIADAETSWLAGDLSQVRFDRLVGELEQQEVDLLARTAPVSTVVTGALDADDVVDYWGGLELAERRSLIESVFSSLRVRRIRDASPEALADGVDYVFVGQAARS